MSTNISNFFSSSRQYFVVGASSNPSKFGYKVLKWYSDRSLPVVPINPTSSQILGISTSKDINEAFEKLEEGNQGVSVSFITPPNVTNSVLNSIKDEFKKTLKGVWFQPGTFDENTISKSQELGIETIVAFGDCILVLGDSYIDTGNKL
ncbi:hypothetical protein WICMUC_003162 [Wickerhamomyces mucosus]|uniref:CoA-binding domain-containing protein n=1 Tax=Wickerhamomyces mucosus TaxID=1378264 RepID=A0A9P8TDS5_9ASCO|nr:hypothetical protein WICMUC_003162 [Wickerhamomyces mucosus]